MDLYLEGRGGALFNLLQVAGKFPDIGQNCEISVYLDLNQKMLGQSRKVHLTLNMEL